jgi:hypothetical protein
MITYIFYWLSGEYEILQGTSPANALSTAGYGQGALRALDFYEEGTVPTYEWIDGKWSKKDE